MADEFCLKMPDFHVTFRDPLHAVNLRHGTNGFTSLPKEGVLRIFSPWKIRRIRPGLNPRTWVPKASTLPLDHRSRLNHPKCCSFPCSEGVTELHTQVIWLTYKQESSYKLHVSLAISFKNKSTDWNIKTNKTRHFREKRLIASNWYSTYFGPSESLSKSFKCRSEKCIRISTAYIHNYLWTRKVNCCRRHPVVL